MHAAAFAYVARALKGLPPRRAVVELGSRDINGSVRQLFMGAAYVGVDVAEGPGVDVVADGATFAPDFPPDTVVCCEVLEHADNAPEIIANAHRMLAPGGLFLMTCATSPRAPHSASDGGPLTSGEFYMNVDPDEARDWCGAFRSVEIEVDERVGDLRLAAWKE